MSSLPFYLTEDASVQDLFHRMESPDREECQSYGHMKTEQCFIDRIFVVYKPQGLKADGGHRDPVQLTQIKVTGFRVSGAGSEIDLEDLGTNQVMTVSYIPKRLFHYDAFVSVPPKMRLNWDAQNVRGHIRRAMHFQVLVKVRSRGDFYSAGVTGVETPAKFRELYPDVTLKLINQ
jgi:hypothetical protein